MSEARQRGVIVTEGMRRLLHVGSGGRREDLAPNFTVDTRNASGWVHCKAAESKLVNGIGETGVIVIGEVEDPLLLLKVRGRISGVALRDINLPKRARMREGYWYSPVGETRQTLREAFDEGNARLVLASGDWAEIRPVRGNNEHTTKEVMDRAKAFAKEAPKTYPNDQIEIYDKAFDTMRTLTRREYRGLY